VDHLAASGDRLDVTHTCREVSVSVDRSIDVGYTKVRGTGNIIDSVTHASASASSVQASAQEAELFTAEVRSRDTILHSLLVQLAPASVATFTTLDVDLLTHLTAFRTSPSLSMSNLHGYLSAI
jgi:hypothetical protein